MARPAFLEAFELAPAPEPEAPTGPSQDWLDGHASGYAEGLADAAAEEGRLSDELVQCLNDQAFGYFEARDHLLQALRPLFEALLRAFLPRLAAQSLSPQIEELLMAQAAERLDEPVTIAVSPGVEPRLHALLERLDAPPLRFVSDPGLTDLQAMVSGASGEGFIDLEGVLAEASEILAALETPARKATRHG